MKKGFIQIEKNPPKIEKINEYNYQYLETWGVKVVEKWDDFIIDNLYEVFKELNTTSAIIISKEDFKKFLLWALPKYYEEVLK